MTTFKITDADEPTEAKEEPKPGETAGKKRRGRPPGSKNKTQQNFVKEFEQELDALLKMLAMVWSVRDQVCSAVLNESSSLIAHDVAELAGTSPKAREFLQSTLELGKVVPLLMHLTPLLVTIRDHHLTSKNEEADDDGTYPVA